MLLWELLGGSQSPAPSKVETAGGGGGGGEGGGAAPVLQDHHIALVESIHESARLKLRMFYKVGVAFLCCVHYECHNYYTVWLGFCGHEESVGKSFFLT